MTAILCVGHSALDTIYSVPEIPTVPIKVLASACIESGGGMAANASVAASRLGAMASYCGRVGDDTAGTSILAELAAELVDVTMVRRIEGCRSPTAAILIDRHGERPPAAEPIARVVPASIDSLVIDEQTDQQRAHQEPEQNRGVDPVITSHARS